MAKNNEPISRQDTHHIQKRTFSQEHDAIRTVPACDIETSFSLNHKEDSVVAKTASRVLEPGKLVDVSDLQKVQAYGHGLVVIYAMDNASYELQVTPGQIFEICAMSLKSDVVLVGR